MKERVRQSQHKRINIGLMVLALAIAFALWAYVMVVNDPDKTMEITDIPITFMGEDSLYNSQALVMTSDANKTITLSLRGRISDLFQLTRDKIKVVVDLSTLTRAGDFALTYNVEYPIGLRTGQVNATSTTKTVTVTVDQIDTKPIAFNIKGAIAPEDGFARGKITMEPAVLMVNGPAKQLEAISYAELELPQVDPISSTLTLQLPFKLFDESGKRISMEHITTDVEMVSVTIPVTMLKQIPLVMEFKDGGGLVAKDNISYTCEPAMITVAGDAEELDVLNKIVLDTLDLSMLMEPTSLTRTIPLPNGVEVTSGETTAKVSIDIHGAETKTLEISPYAIGYTHVQGYTLEFITNLISVKLRGSPEALQAINSSSIRAVIDMTSVVLSPGIPTELPVTVTIQGQISNAGVLGTYTAFVAMVPLEPEEESP